MPVWTFSTRIETFAVAGNKTQHLPSAPCSPYIKLGFLIPAFHRPNNYIDLLKPPIPNGQQSFEHEGQITRKRSLRDTLSNETYIFYYISLIRANIWAVKRVFKLILKF